MNSVQRRLAAFMLIACVGVSGQVQAATGSNIPEKRFSVRSNTEGLVAKLEKADPDAKARIDQSAGYGAFTSSGMGTLLPGGFGTGMVKDKAKNSETFMRMFNAPSGWGEGMKSYTVVFVFETAEALSRFTSARDYVLPASAIEAAKANGKAEVEVEPGVWLYQLNDKGAIAPALTGKGVKFYPDEELN